MWHYQIRHRVLKGKVDYEDFYDIVEVYDIDGKIGWTRDSMEPHGESKEEVIRDLKMMLHDAEKHPVLEDTEND